MKINNSKLENSIFFIVFIALAIFIAGVQIGIKHGRALELDDLRIKYGYWISD